jgi:tetratricopeptide (TPR) repeat protein
MNSRHDDQPGAGVSPAPSPRRSGVRAAVVLFAAIVLLAGVGAWSRWWTPSRLPPVVALEDSSPPVRVAIESARQAVVQDPRSAGEWGAYGMCLYAHGFAPQALDCFEQAGQLDAQDYRWPYLSGIAATFTDPARGRDCFLRAARLRPELVFVQLRAAELLLDLNQLNDADLHLQAALVREPGNPRALLAAARLALLQGDLARSRSSAAQCLERAPGAPAALDLLARVCFQQGDKEASLKYQSLLQHSPLTSTDWPDPLLMQIMGLRRDENWRLFRIQEQIERGRTAEAAAALEQAVADFPDSVEFRIELARVYAQSGQNDRIGPVLEEGLRREPGSARLRRLLGLWHHQQGRLDVAVRELRHAVDLKPDYGLAHDNLGQCLLDLGDESGALLEFESAAALQPDLPGLRQRLADLQERLPDQKEVP